MTDKREFIRKVRGLDTASLNTLFNKLKEDNAPLGMILFVGRVYSEKSRNPSDRIAGSLR